MKKILSLVLAAVMVLCTAPIMSIGALAVDGITLSSTESADYSDLNEAINATPNGGTITVKGSYRMPSDFKWTDHGKSVTITGGIFNTTSVSTLQIRDSVTFKATELSWGGTVYANGNALRVESDVTVTGTLTGIYGGGNVGSVERTDLTLLSGNYENIYGGSNKGTVNRDTYVYVGGNANSDCDTLNHSATHNIYGGGNGDTVKGNTHVIFGENAKVSYIFGGSTGSNARINGTAYLDITGGNIFSLYGAGNRVDCVSNTLTTITGGTFHQIFGGAQNAAVTGNVTLRIWGGTITRRIYGGCYNEYNSGWKSSYGVSGTVKLVLGSGASVTYSASDSDKAVFTRSRQKNKVDGTAVLYYSDASASSTKNLKEGRYILDFGGSIALKGISPADKTHELSHKASGNVITETCSCGCGHSATATLRLKDNASLSYTGAHITPAYVEYSDSWIGEPLGEVTYKNNVAPGTATATAVFPRKALTATLKFDVTITDIERMIAIAEGRLEGSYTLSENLSFANRAMTEATLISTVNAVNSGRIIMKGFAFTDLSVAISSPTGLASITDYTRGSFTLTKDIDMGGISLSKPYLTLSDSNLSGNGHSIFNYSTAGCGLIAVSGTVDISSIRLGSSVNRIVSVSDSGFAAPLCVEVPRDAALTVKELKVFASSEGKAGAGGIVGRALGTVVLEGCALYGSVVSEALAGGLVAEAERLSITASSNFAEVSGATAGGLVGYMVASGSGISIKDSKNYGNVYATDTAGGLIGCVEGVASIKNSDNNRDVVGNRLSGGIIGQLLGSADIHKARNSGSVTNPQSGEYAGAIVGKAGASSVLTVDGSLNIGTVGSATEGSGAMIGLLDGGAATVKNTANAGPSILNTDTPMVYGGAPTLEGNYSLPMKNNSEGVTTFADITEALTHLNEAGEGLMISTDGSSLVYGTPLLYGVQRSEARTITKSGRTYDVFSVRFIVIINSTLDYKRLGLSIRAGDGQYVNKDTEYVYTTLLATEEGGEQVEVTAKKLGGAYVYAITVDDVPVDGISADGGITLSAVPYATDKAGNEYVGTEKSITYIGGKPVAIG